MGLDATVYCNCFETGRLKESPPDPALVEVCDNGSLECRSENSEVLSAFDEWLQKHACEHEGGVLVSHWIGNASHVGSLRSELEKDAKKFFILLEKVLYSGTHTGDYLSGKEVLKLQKELKALTEFAVSNKGSQSFVDEFRMQMKELANAALSVKKPISF